MVGLSETSPMDMDQISYVMASIYIVCDSYGNFG